VKATFRSKGFQGSVSKSISVETNDPEKRVVRLTLKGQVVADVSVEPRHVNFGKLNRNEPPPPVRLEIKLRQGKELKIKEVTAAGPVVMKKVKETNDGAVYELGLTKDAAVGRLQGSVSIETSSRNSPEIQVPFYGTIEGNVRATPQFLSLAAVPPGGEVQREITLVKTGKSGFSVLGIQASSDKIKTELHPVREGEEVRVKVTYRADPEATGRISEKLQIVVKAGTEERLEVPVYGTIYLKREPPPLR